MKWCAPYSVSVRCVIMEDNTRKKDLKETWYAPYSVSVRCIIMRTTHENSMRKIVTSPIYRSSPPHPPAPPSSSCSDTYVHRSGRTGRAGRAGVAVTLYADNEVNDVRRIEQGVGQGFKFERGAVPSAEQVMSLAGTVAREQIKGVSEEMVGYFLESAQELLAEGDSEVIPKKNLCFFHGSNQVPVENSPNWYSLQGHVVLQPQLLRVTCMELFWYIPCGSWASFLGHPCCSTGGCPRLTLPCLSCCVRRTRRCCSPGVWLPSPARRT